MPRRGPAYPVAVHWSKDFVEHLRTVHFTLVAVSVGMILILLRSSPAISQIRQIVELKASWHPERYSETVWDEKTERQNLIEPLLFSWVMVKVGEAGDKESSTAKLWLPPKCNEENSGPPQLGLKVDFPETLAEFRDWWNGLGTESLICFVADTIVPEGSTDGNGVSEKWQAIYFEDAEEMPDPKMQLYPDVTVLGSIKGQPKHWLEYHFKVDSGGTGITIRSVRLNKFVLSQDMIIQMTGGVWKRGPFQQSFDALAGEAIGFEDKRIEDVKEILTERLAKSPEDFEAFGMKFPISQITVWGTVILLGIQFYFFLYLRQLSGKLCPEDPGWDVPWICMDQSKSGRVIFFVTVVALPFVVMLLIGLRAWRLLTAGYAVPGIWHLLRLTWYLGWSALLRISYYLFGTIFALTLGIFSWRFRPRLSGQRESRRPNQLFE